MGFFTGRITFSRYRVEGHAPEMFGLEHLDRLAEYQAGQSRLASADGIEVGWNAGDHIFDNNFDLAKNVVDDMLRFSLRIDQEKLPSDLLRAYYEMDLKALSANNPSGLPSARQKREAKEGARDRLEQEAKDGRYRKRKTIEVVWDRLSNELYFGTTSAAQVDRLLVLFRNTFNVGFEAITAGKRAFDVAELNQATRHVDDATPSAFVPGITPEGVAWIVDERSRDFLGNEFLLWLWYLAEAETDTIKLMDNSEATFMLARTLQLDCPRGQTGNETINSEGPTRLPEARRAIQSGKLPRKVGLTLVRHGVQYDMTIVAETLSITGLKIPVPEEDNDRARMEARAQQIRDLIETLDLMFDAFGRRRFSGEWTRELLGIQKWLNRDEPRRMSA